MKKKIIVSTFAVLTCVAILAVFAIFSGCSSGEKSTNSNSEVSVDESMGTNGIRKDIEAYINETYPDSAKKRAALTSYARALQTAYTEVASEEDAINMEPKIINALECVGIFEKDASENSPVRVVGRKTSNTPERLEKQLRYESFLDGKVFSFPSSDDDPSAVCDFDPNSLPN